MIAINSNITALSVYNQSRLNHLEYNEKIERLTSGNRINRGADDPSGLNIAVGMRAQIEGLATATHNIQDGINMLHFLDGVFEVTNNILQRQRDISMRIANEATMYHDPSKPEESDMQRLYNEMQSLNMLLVKFFKSEPPWPGPGDNTLPSIRYNTKPILMNNYAIFRDPVTGAVLRVEEHRHLTHPMGEDLQVGPNSGSEFAVNIRVDDFEGEITNIEQWLDTAQTSWTEKDWGSFGRAGIDIFDDMITLVNKVRAQIAVQENGLKAALGDIRAEYINVSAGKSRIMDADMAVEIAAFTKNQIKNQSTMAIASQANAAPLIIVPLLQAVYDGLSDSGGET